MKRRDDTWHGAAFEAYKEHAQRCYPLPFWGEDGKRYVMCSSCGFFGSTESFSLWGGSGLAAYMGICRNCAKNETV